MSSYGSPSSVSCASSGGGGVVKGSRCRVLGCVLTDDDVRDLRLLRHDGAGPRQLPARPRDHGPLRQGHAGQPSWLMSDQNRTWHALPLIAHAAYRKAPPWCSPKIHSLTLLRPILLCVGAGVHRELAHGHVDQVVDRSGGADSHTLGGLRAADPGRGRRGRAQLHRAHPRHGDPRPTPRYAQAKHLPFPSQEE